MAVFIPIAFFAFLALVILGSGWFAHRGRLAALGVIGEAIGKGLEVNPDLVDRLMTSKPAPVGKWFAIICFFFGAVGIAMGFTLGTSAIVFGEGLKLGDAGRAGMMVGAYINGCVGAGFTTLGVMSLHYFSGRTRPAPKWDYGTSLGLVCLFFGTGGLSAGSGLTFGAMGYGKTDPSGETFAGMMVGALTNLSIGIALTLLAIMIFRLFAETRGEASTGERQKAGA